MLRFIFLCLVSFTFLSANEESPADSECVNEPGLAYEYYETPPANMSYLPPANLGWCSTPCYCPCRYENDAQYARETGLGGIWLPEAPVLFQPFAADPREICYSLAWRLYDRALAFECTHHLHPLPFQHRHRHSDVRGNNIVACSFGDQFPIYRFFNLWPRGCGELQIDLQGALWAVFAPSHDFAPLINADYYVGVPISYAFGCWSFRLRGYHISCHIGDEFMVLKPDVHRRNPSSEFIDFFVSYYYAGQIRIYGGAGLAVTQDSTFKNGRAFVEGGTEVRPAFLRCYNARNRFYSVPLFAMHFAYRDRHNEHIDCTYILGYEWGKCSGWQHKTRVYLQYHDGYSLEGQFSNRPTKYFSIMMSYGY